MSSFDRLRVLDVSIAWWAVLALNGLAAGCGGDGPTELPDVSRDRSIFAAYNFDPAPSPDGNRITFVSDEHGSFTSIR